MTAGKRRVGGSFSSLPMPSHAIQTSKALQLRFSFIRVEPLQLGEAISTPNNGLFSTYLTLKPIRFLGCLLFLPRLSEGEICTPHLHLFVFISPSFSLYSFSPNVKRTKNVGQGLRPGVERGRADGVVGRLDGWRWTRGQSEVLHGARVAGRNKRRGGEQASGTAHAAVMFKQCSCPST